MNAPYAVGGCARDQSTTQYCGEAVAAHRRIAELEALVRDLSANYRAACAQLQGESGDAEFWGEDAKLLARCDALIGKG